MSTLEELKLKRRAIKSSITRHQTAIDEFKDGDNTQALEQRLSDITELFTNYNSTQFQIETLQYANVDSDQESTALDEETNKERTKIESQYYNLIAKIKTTLIRNNPQQQNLTNQSSTVINIQGNSDHSENSNFLKPLSLPTFSGKHSNWYSFFDSFTALVDTDNSLSNIKKFHYLRGCLKDDALRAIESLSVSGDNYAIAMELLKKRFENKRLIVQEHINNILHMSTMTKASHLDLRHLLDTLNNNVAALKTLQLPVDSWDALIISIIQEKLDFYTKKEWQTKLNKELPTYSDFNEFLEKRYQILEALTSVKNSNIHSHNQPSNNSKNFKYNSFKKPTQNQNYATLAVSKFSCTFCKKSHNIFQCHEFLNLNITDRLNQVDQLKLCRNCLRNNHTTEQCKSTSVCKECKQRHHTLLHINEFNPPHNSLCLSSSNQTLLSTAVILIADKFGNFHTCRILLDQCSQANIITSTLCNKLSIPCTKINTSITGVNLSDTHITKCANVTIKSRVSEFATNFDCLLLPQITRSTPSTSLDKHLIELPPNIKLADPNFHISQEIDLLIGAQLYWRLLEGGPVQLKSNQPYFQQTKLGWILGGSINLQTQTPTVSCNLTMTSIESDLEKQVTNFFNQEEIQNESLWSQEQTLCDIHFCTNTVRASNGQFIVKLPFKENAALGNSRDLALKQFKALEQRLLKSPSLQSSYLNFMREYEQLGHMKPIPNNELETPCSYYMPHHPVFKQTINGPKLRVVYNASAKSSNGMSLNDNLMTGPTIQQDLFSILCRFRTYQFVLSADITQMFRMILVDDADQEFQRILWRDDPNKPIKTFRLKTVTYGTTCAPFLAVRCLNQLALESEGNNPIANTIIPRDFYIDDLLTGSNTINEAILIRDQVSSVLKSGGFNLCKWASNSYNLLPKNFDETSVINLDKNGDVKVLGFFWNCHNDELKYKVDLNISTNKNVTKRNILSIVAKIFDPLGLINPVVVTAKILLQHIWSLKINWDQPLPPNIMKSWNKFMCELSDLNNYRIARKVVNAFPYSSIEIHGFADASTKAYGAVIYLKTLDASGNAVVNLLCAKSRVALLKPVTLPRLELNAAVLLTNLMARVTQILNIQIENKYYWTDSTIVLSWLAEPSNNWKQYIANRVAQIQLITALDEWRHVRSGDNPADIISRGMYPQQLHNSALWWHGPKWLIRNANEWPTLLNPDNSNKIEITACLERKTAINVNIIQIEDELQVFTKISSFQKLQRIIGYCFRFFNICKTKIKIRGSITTEELSKARITIFKQIQGRHFANEISSLISNQAPKFNKLSKLDIFLDDSGLLRVGGRIRHAPINYDNKFPILLPEKHHITRLIIRETHEINLHAGSEATLAAVRQQFWPLQARNTVRKIVHSCFKCSRANPKYLNQKMGNLPKERLQPIRPFYTSGVDYAGPFLIKESKARNIKKIKAYVALFICFSTKAIHLELVTDLTTESFLASLKRFISRRGNVANLYSDNGTNFVGAERELIRSEEFQNNIIDSLASKNTKFHFIPPKSPHFGGLWERAVRSVKHHLKRVLGDASVTYEEFYTLLTCIEACLNSRPITPLSSDPNDLEPLTPGHFLIGAPLTAPIEDDLKLLKLNRLSRWQRIQQLQQHFWSRWHKEYLSQLQTRPKGQQVEQPNITIGTMVALIEENLPPLKWELGRVVQTHPGCDGIVRVVTIKTANGFRKRAIKKVCVIPSASELSN